MVDYGRFDANLGVLAAAADEERISRRGIDEIDALLRKIIASQKMPQPPGRILGEGAGA